MIINLFSIFDPSTKIINLSLNWLRVLLGLFILSYKFWLLPNRNFLFLNKISIALFLEFKVITNNKMNRIILLLISLFFFILTSNFLGLFPYIFTSTRHLILTLTLTLPFWLTFLIFGWINKTKEIFIHLVPQNTPIILISFIVCIETVRIFIRPVTLSIRLAANIIAGHLLIALLGNLGSILNLLFIPYLLIIQIILLILESAVAIIQSYVFVVLLTLYYREIYLFTKSSFPFSKL